MKITGIGSGDLMTGFAGHEKFSSARNAGSPSINFWAENRIR
ncbi:hypothetical protein [Enterocloster asparagiformis]|nr:hypothetical protein [Enterocloster asparagiformis]